MAYPRALVLALALASGAGCSLLLGFDDPIVDPRPDAVTIDGRLDAGTDQFEPNDTPELASPIGPGSYELSILPDTDKDFLGIVSTGILDVTVTISFSNLEGDLDLRLRNSAMTDIASSNGTSDTEVVMQTALPPDTYLIYVYAVARAPTIYRLDVQYTITPLPDAATDAL